MKTVANRASFSQGARGSACTVAKAASSLDLALRLWGSGTVRFAGGRATRRTDQVQDTHASNPPFAPPRLPPKADDSPPSSEDAPPELLPYELLDAFRRSI